MGPVKLADHCNEATRGLESSGIRPHEARSSQVDMCRPSGAPGRPLNALPGAADPGDI